LIVELDHLETRVHPVGVEMIGPQLQWLGGRHRALFPVVFHRAVVETIPERAQQDTGEFPVMKARGEGFEARNLLAYRLRVI